MGETEKINNILTCNNIKPPVEGRCGFFVKRKQRFCKMIPGKGNKFCAEHLCEDKDMVRIFIYKKDTMYVKFWLNLLNSIYFCGFSLAEIKIKNRLSIKNNF